MSYCLNPNCVKPENPDDVEVCQSCGSKLLLNDQYKAIKVLGRGGFGTTFLAIDTKLPGNPSCVIKQLRPAATAPHILAMARELFLREATTLGKVGNHPQLPRLLGYFENENEFYLIQEYVGGLTLQQEVKRFGPKSEEEVKQVLQEVLPILDYLHKNGVIHRDIKPANLIRRDIDNKLVLIDFGAVKDKVTQAMVENAPELSTFTSFAVGTPMYAPPEQMAMRPIYASDIYALGVTCVYLLTGKSPKEIERDPHTGEWHWKRYVKNISPEFAALLDKMLEDSVKNRYQSAIDVLADLQLLDCQETPALAAPTVTAEDDDLSNALAAPPSQGRPRGSAQSSSYASSVRQNAAAARLRQSRMTGSPWGGPPVVGVGSGQHLRPKVTVRMTAAQVLTAYKRGERDFVDVDLSNVVLRNADLSGANFANANFTNADLKGCILTNVVLREANLQGANLSDANLCGAYLVQANFERANLKGAKLQDASISGANFTGADISGADFSMVSGMVQGQLDRAKKNWFTKLPKY
ncbi:MULTISPECIES: serine/threonine-protein kinase [unclassified Thermosynechococcus]|uniref:serine/threonine-protein kinase n=1 Tax=unclassified Thermosynechococcus TaxID=2622553 RepID=UPI002872D1AC|nr:MULTISPECIES: serine/threonine-protein kinase [unclassified Thermosynechococcus]WNC22869.1 serine/threonine-protein kinase [Thermosynechococcus sp. PP22]WNC30571.1 serine/threonine-protein kinase [Thermosynechococcus sp. PKX82]WNC33112.1 serine/threonine-protein kinase [Thermosynechococcus sp. PKX95]WNC35638.1 serine/threonine-protein kinase [Thermosynechococcus sp. PKX91]WNC38160.1 serine/threonine-protein kinase [Thermosynechococcus sp. WL11]